MSKSVAQRLAAPRWLPTLLPSLRGRMGSERIQRASKQILKFELSPWTSSLFTCPLHATHLHSAKQG